VPSPFGVLPTTAPFHPPTVASAWQRWRAAQAAAAAAQRAAQAPPPAPSPQHIRYGRCPAGSSLHCRLYALSPRGDGTFDASVVGYIVPGGTFQIGPAQIINLRTDQPGSFGLQAVSMVPVVYGSASGWMPTSAFENVP